MSQPRAPRRGGKKIDSTSTPPAAEVAAPTADATTASPEPQQQSQGSASSTSAIPHPTLSGSFGGGGSSILSSFLETIDPMASPAMASASAGMVRGRGQTTPLKESRSSVARNDIANKVTEFIARVSQRQTSPASPSSTVAVCSPSEIAKADVTLLSDFERLSVVCRLVKDDSSAKVLLVCPPGNTDGVISEAKDVVSDAALVGSWTGAVSNCSEKTRLLVTDYQGFVVYMSAAVRQSVPNNAGEEFPFGRFSHLCLWNATVSAKPPSSQKEAKATSVAVSVAPSSSPSAPTLVDAVLCLIRYHFPKQLPQPKSSSSSAAASGNKRPKLLLIGFDNQQTNDSISRFFAPLHVRQVEPAARSHSVLIVDHEESAALVNATLKEAGPNLLSHRYGAVETLHPRVAEHAVDTAVQLLAYLVDQKPTQRLTVCVFAAEPSEIVYAIRRKISASSDGEGGEEAAAASKALKQLHILTSAKAAVPEDDSKHIVYVFGGSLPDHVAVSLRAQVVIDVGTEKRTLAPPKAEAFFPIRQVSISTRQTSAQRQRVLGWEAEGAYFCLLKVLAGSDEQQQQQLPTTPPAGPVVGRKNNNSSNTPGSAATPSSSSAGSLYNASSLAEGGGDFVPSLCEAILSFSRNGISATHLTESAIHQQQQQQGGGNSRHHHQQQHHPSDERVKQIETAMQLLAEQGYIASATEPYVTFAGDLVGRLGIPVDQGLLVVHGLALGVPELSALVAAVTVHPLSTSATGPPASFHHLSQEQWIKACGAARKARDPSGGCSDVLGDAAFLIEYAAAGADKRESLAEEAGVPTRAADVALGLFADLARTLHEYAFIFDGGAADASSPLAALPSLDDLSANAPLLVYLIAGALARRAIVVRAEDDAMKGAKAKGNMVFTRTSKEVQTGTFAPTCLAWQAGTIVVATGISNTHNKMFANGGTQLTHKGFHAALLLLHPCLSYDQTDDDAVTFLVKLHHQSKRLKTDLATSARILNFREKWCRSFGCVQLRRSLPAATQTQLGTLIASADRKLNVVKLKQEIRMELLALIQDIETREVQQSYNQPLSRIHNLAPAAPVHLDPSEVEDGGDMVVAKQIRNMDFKHKKPKTFAVPKSQRASGEEKGASSSSSKPGNGRKQRQQSNNDDEDVVVEAPSKSELLVAAIIDDDDVVEDADSAANRAPIIDDD